LTPIGVYRRTAGRKLRAPVAEAQRLVADAVSVVRLDIDDQAAMTELYDRYASLVYSVALRVLADTGQAEDVLQEVFLQLWRNPGAFNAARGRLGPWLAVVARHKAVDQLRSRREHVDITCIMGDIVLATDARLDEGVDCSRASKEIRRVLGDMGAEQRKCLEMAFFEGLTHPEIAQQTGAPLGTVKTRIRRGLQQLRRAFRTCSCSPSKTNALIATKSQDT
jgi:RNA polymerase sigma-70 factor (ECF subfamily)